MPHVKILFDFFSFHPPPSRKPAEGVSPHHSGGGPFTTTTNPPHSPLILPTCCQLPTCFQRFFQLTASESSNSLSVILPTPCQLFFQVTVRASSYLLSVILPTHCQ